MIFFEGMLVEFDMDIFWSLCVVMDCYFWEELQFCNIFNNYIYVLVFGYCFDGVVVCGVENLICCCLCDSLCVEGWVIYFEEMFFFVGFICDVFCVDEFFYVVLMKWVSCIYVEFGMYGGILSFDEVNCMMIDMVFYMEENFGCYDFEGYLWRFGLGSGYIIGKVQFEQLFFECVLQFGDDFRFGEFYDEVFYVGLIFFMLLCWELFGESDEVVFFWQVVMGQEFGE